MNSVFKGFPSEARAFLRQLARNNNREWFVSRKDVYETKVKEPMIELVTARARGSALQSGCEVGMPGRCRDRPGLRGLSGKSRRWRLLFRHLPEFCNRH
ncbi:MAG: DUF2461 family protein [Acidobacteria bacterium]|nr:DUF2461 family protein [Acidobacteriota bacterium]